MIQCWTSDKLKRNLQNLECFRWRQKKVRNQVKTIFLFDDEVDKDKTEKSERRQSRKGCDVLTPLLPDGMLFPILSEPTSLTRAEVVGIHSVRFSTAAG